MLKSIFSFMLNGTLLFSSNPIENIGGNKATADEVSQSVVTLDEVFVSETGILADGKSGDYVGIPSQAFEPRQAFDNVTVDATKQDGFSKPSFLFLIFLKMPKNGLSMRFSNGNRIKLGKVESK